ncbi:MAG: SIS domain-containing protein [Abditibacteriota bacterium]|nr:SIS domain-containing protein [Abditibacteriota bacterium]
MKKPFDDYPELLPLEPALDRACGLLCGSVKSGGRILVCGNGGSAADSEHIAGELLKGFLLSRPIDGEMREALEQCGGARLADGLQQGIDCVSLVSHTALMTAVINDNGAEYMFAQQVCAMGRKGDVLIGLTTSGNAVNVVNAAICARARGMSVIGFTGSGGGRLKPFCDALLNVPSDVTYRVQEYHIPLYHYLCGALEEKIFGA